jgi:hypothetical protein
MHAQSPQDRPVADSIDFEITDFEQARHALEEPPPGVGRVPRVDHGRWEPQRRKPVPTDRALSGLTLQWLVNLPPGLQPRMLAEKYPRLANEIALHWSDHLRSAGVIDALFADRRGGRRGFPFEVESELRALRQYLEVMLRRGSAVR